MPPPLRRLVPWLLRLVWGLLPIVAGPAFAAALDGRSRPVQLVASIGLWGVWAGVLLATLVLTSIGLTAIRLAAPTALVASVAAAGSDGVGRAGPVAVAWAAVVVGVAFSPAVGVDFVNGPAYPDERRHLLRVPGPLLVGPLPLAWLVVAGAPSAAALLLAAQAWVAGGIVAVVGLPAAVLLARSIHGLSTRWLVFVPAGVVLHDRLSVLDPVLFQTKVVEAIHAAPADTDSLDLTQGAPGLALELLLREKVDMTLVQGRGGEMGASARLLVTPTRPGAVLADAASRRLPTG